MDGALQSNNRFWLLERPESKRFLTVVLQFSAWVILQFVARLEAAPARRSVPHSFMRHFNPPRAPRTAKQSTAADGWA
jgi:hypothetical protein